MNSKPTITPESIDSLFTEEVLSVLPSDRNIKLGVANFNKAQDPEWQKKHAAAMKLKGQSPDYRRKMKQAAAERANNPEWIDTMRRVKSTDEQVEIMKRGQSVRMTDAELRARTASAVSKTKQELKAQVRADMIEFVNAGFRTKVAAAGCKTNHDIAKFVISSLSPERDSQQIMFVLMELLSKDNERTIRSTMARASADL